MNNNNIFYVYGYIRLDTNTYFYIGKGKGNRCERLDNRKQHFINIFNKVNCCYEILYDNLSEEEAFELEIKTIEDLVFNEGYSIDIPNYKCLKNKESNLVNLTWGGDGTTGYSIKQSAETIMNRVAKNTGKKRTQLQKENLSNARKNYINNNKAELERIRNLRKGAKLSNETKSKLRDLKLGTTRNIDSINKAIETYNNKTDEEKALINKKRSESVKKSKQLKSKFRIYIYNRKNILIKNFYTIKECCEWLTVELNMNSWRTVKSNLNSYINRNKLYKDKYYIVKKEVSPATTEYENAVINSEATV